MLLQNGARRGATDRSGRTALHYVALYRCVDEDAAKLVELIVGELVATARRRPDAAVGAFVNRQDVKGKTALQLAAHHGQLTAVRALIGRGADVGVADKHGCTPLHAAANAKVTDEVSESVSTRQQTTFKDSFFSDYGTAALCDFCWAHFMGP